MAEFEKPSDQWNRILSEALKQYTAGELDDDAFQKILDVAAPKGHEVMPRRPDGNYKVFFSQGYSPPEGVPDPVIPEGFTALQALAGILGAFGLALRTLHVDFFGRPYLRKTPKSDPKKSDPKKSDPNKAGRDQRRKEMLADRAKDVAKSAIPTGAAVITAAKMKELYPDLVDYVDQQLVTFQQNIESMVQPTLDRIDALVSVLNAVPWLEIAETWRLMKPAVYDLNNEVLRPYLDAVKAGKDFLPAYQDMLKQAGNHVDSPLGYTPPNLDAEKMAGIVQALNLPVIGSIYRGMLQVMLVQQYQAQHGRGYRTELDALAACAGVSNQPVMSPGDVADAVDIPKWILR